MTNPPGTDLDLAALLAKGWADRGDFPDAEFDQALAFYRAMRDHDGRLSAVRARASGMIGEWTGRGPRDGGSVCTVLNLGSSGLDLGIGYPGDNRGHQMAAPAGCKAVLGRGST